MSDDPLFEKDEEGWKQRPIRAWGWHKRFIVFATIVVLLGLFAPWRAGTFDRALYNVGLNAKECAHNGFGALYCGQELTEYRERIARLEQEGKEREQKIKAESKEAEQRAKAQSEVAGSELMTM